MNARYIARRALQSAFLLLLVSVVVFLILKLVPGDPATVMLGGQATSSEIEQLRKQMGLDKPVAEQYLRYFMGMIQGDFGTSIRTQRPVLQYVGQYIPASLELVSTALLVVVALGIPLGLVAAIKYRTLADYVVIVFSLIGQSMPGFWLGLLLIILFSVKLNVLPPFGGGGISHLVLPTATLALLQMGLVARITRSEMLSVLTQDYIRTSRAKGLAETVVLTKHALRNALIPIVTVLGVQFGTLLGGAVVIETVFSWPGIGNLIVNAIYQRDYPVAQGVVLLSAGSFVLINFLVDALYIFLDPRISYQ